MKLQVPKFFLFAIIGFLPASLFSQVNSCDLNLIEAKKQFNAGQIEEVPGLLLDCIEGGLSPESRMEAYKLVINAYIYDDYPDLAEQYMLKFLTDYPDYQVNDEDPFEFVALMEMFDTEVKFSMSGFAGTNFAMASVSEPFGVYNLNSVEGNYSAAPGFQIGAAFNYHLKKGIELSAEPMFSKSGYSCKVDPFSFTSTEFTENHLRLDVPLSVVYVINDKPVSPYVRAGLMSSFLLSANASIKRDYQVSEAAVFSGMNEDDLNVLDERNKLQFSAFFGAGVRYQLSHAWLFADLRYNYGFTQQVIGDSRRTAGNSVWSYYYLQDSYFLNQLTFSIGYTKTFYKPKRKK